MNRMLVAIADLKNVCHCLKIGDLNSTYIKKEVGGLNPTSAETHMWVRRLSAMLPIYTDKGIAPEVYLRECISHICLHQSVNKAAHSGFATQRRYQSPKQGYQWLHKWTCIQQKIYKKRYNTAWCVRSFTSYSRRVAYLVRCRHHVERTQFRIVKF